MTAGVASELLLPAGTTTVVTTGDGAELAVTDVGQGPTVVLAHGWTEQREIWAPVTRRLVDAGLRVVLYDQRGHGSSTIGTAGCTITALAGDLRAVLEAVDARDAVLGGHSMGGMTILSLVTEHPGVMAERVRGLALVSTGAGGMGPVRGAALMLRLLTAPWLTRLFRGRLGPLLVRRTVGRHARPEHLRLTADLFAACSTTARAGFAEAMFAMDLHACLPTIAVPTTVMVGTLDRLTPPPLADTLATAVPGARLIRLEGLGHQLPLEAPDRVAEEIRALTT